MKQVWLSILSFATLGCAQQLELNISVRDSNTLDPVSGRIVLLRTDASSLFSSSSHVESVVNIGADGHATCANLIVDDLLVIEPAGRRPALIKIHQQYLEVVSPIPKTANVLESFGKFLFFDYPGALRVPYKTGVDRRRYPSPDRICREIPLCPEKKRDRRRMPCSCQTACRLRTRKRRSDRTS
jgi:hypothetical protein